MNNNKKIILVAGISSIIALGLFLGIPRRYETGKEQVLESRADESIASVYASLSPQAQKLYMKQSNGLTKPVPERLVELDQLKMPNCGTHQAAAGTKKTQTCTSTTMLET